MKLPKAEAGRQASAGGNHKQTAVMEDTWMDGFSDRGSIPLRSTNEKARETVLFLFLAAYRAILRSLFRNKVVCDGLEEFFAPYF